jgi:arabinogalactan endo-1,4-beta-galactosidase
MRFPRVPVSGLPALLTIALTTALAACSNSGGGGNSKLGGTTGSGGSTGGSTGHGGSQASAGSSGSTGGAAGSGGVTGAGGAPGAGGSQSLGGATASGGTPGIGGTAATGGTTATGGATNTGGTKGTGGTVTTGGVTGTGGTTGTGGATGTGGTTGTGGASGTGGATGTGGGTGTGGAAKTGGTTGAGGVTGTGGAGATGGTTSTGVYKPPFILGADVTITVEDEYWGATYTDNGQQKSIEQLLKDHGFNFIRIGTFVDPGASDGYAATMPETFRDLAHTMAFAKRVKKIGMGVMLDLHYSDTWASPAAQATPLAWAGLSVSALATKVHDYTKDALTQLKSQGAMPDMVSVGNEITNGMLWDTGRISSSDFTNFASLLKAGVGAVREVDPAIVIVMHIEKCNNYTTTKWWLDGVLGQGVSFDVLGQSCYATAPNGIAGYQGTPADWKATFTQLASAYPNLKFLIAEYSAEQRGAGDTMYGVPNKRGLGTFNWDPTRSYDTLPNDPLFSTNGAWNRYVAIPAKMALYEQMAKDYGL